MLGYAYILTHPGTPLVFWEHMYDWGLCEQIQRLVGISRGAAVTFACSQAVISQQMHSETLLDYISAA